MTNILPESRRAEGIAYWGLSTIAAIAVAPSIGFWVFQFGWRALCLETAALNVVMAFIAWRLPPQPIAAVPAGGRSGRLIEWRVLDPVVHAVPVFVRLRRDHELHGALCRRQRRHAEGDLPDALALIILVTRPLSGVSAIGSATGGCSCRAWC